MKYKMNYDNKMVLLNNLQLETFMNQFERKYSDFKFLGCFPINFEEFKYYRIKNKNFKKLIQEGKTKIGFIINQDKYQTHGTYWTSIYIDFLKGSCHFFDPYNPKPKKEITNLFEMIIQFMHQEYHKEIKTYINDYECQDNKLSSGILVLTFFEKFLNQDKNSL